MRYYSVVTDADIYRGFVTEKKKNSCLITFEDKNKDIIFGLFRTQFFKEYPQYVGDEGILGQFCVNVVEESDSLLFGVAFVAIVMSEHF